MSLTSGSRLESLDILRGFDMFWILMPTYPIVHFVLVALGLKGCWLDLQLDHLPWNGFTFYDTIYPLFLFMSGVSFAFSCASSRKKGLSDARIMLRLAKRAILLVLLGSTIFGSLKLDAKTFTLFSVIGRIGISCGLAGCLWLVFPRLSQRVIVFSSILGIYAVLPFVTPCPGAPAGVLPYAEPKACLYAWLDGNVFPYPLFWAGFSGVFPMIATAMAGIFAGEWIRGNSADWRRCVGGLIMAAVVMLALGLLLAFGLGPFSVPVNKPIWSSSYALVSAAYSFGMMAIFYWVVDVRGWRAWGFPFRVIGMNVLFAYLASRTLFPYDFEMRFLFGGLMRLMPTEAWGLVVGQVGYLLVYWLLLYGLYRRNWYVRV